jgi:D,D-heptose 1,7-bisphosphate phosphatase
MAGKNKALFLDRDGTIHIDKNYLYKVEDFELLPGCAELIKAANQKNYLVIVATNQSGIARGMYSVDDMHHLHRHMRAELGRHGAKIDDIFFCPLLDGPDRKPAPGMFLQAARKYAIDMPASLSIGDKERDIQAANAAGVGCNLLLDEAGAVTASAATQIIRTLAQARCYLD